MSMLSVVIPSYNEQENIARTAAALAEILKRTDMDYELLFVDDGSKDETYACICAEAAMGSPGEGDPFQPQLWQGGLHLRRAPGGEGGLLRGDRL